MSKLTPNKDAGTIKANKSLLNETKLHLSEFRQLAGNNMENLTIRGPVMFYSVGDAFGCEHD